MLTVPVGYTRKNMTVDTAVAEAAVAVAVDALGGYSGITNECRQ